MWRFRLQALSEKKSFLLRLSSVSLVLHTIFLAIVFLTNQSYKMQNVSLSAQSAQVRFIPTFDVNKIAQSQKQKNIPKAIVKTSSFSLCFSGKNVQKASAVRESQKKILAAKKLPVQKSSTQLATKKRAAALPVKKVLPAKKIEKKEAIKNVKTPKQTYDFLPDYTQKFSTAGLMNALLHPPVVAAQPEPVPEASPVLEKIAEVSQPVSPSVEANTLVAPDSVQEEVVYVSPREYNALMTQQELQLALQAVWSPPVGMRKTISAQVTITVDSKGKIVDIAFKKPSGILIFDNSIEHALQKIIVPESVWSKILTITFSP